MTNLFKFICVIGCVIVFKVRAEIVASGDDCGPNCSWSFDDKTKTLVVRGTGIMYDYISDSSVHENEGLEYYTNRPWITYVSEIEKIDIGEGITSTGKYFCADCTKLKDVKLPETLEEISLDTFWHTGLKAITVPESVVRISNEAFLGSSSLEKVYCSVAQEIQCTVAVSGSQAGIEPTIYEKYGDTYYIDGRFYEKSQDIGTANYIKKRIYTLDEANKATGAVNRVSIKYR